MFQCVIISRTQQTESAKSIALLDQQTIPQTQISKQKMSPPYLKISLIHNVNGCKSLKVDEIPPFCTKIKRFSEQLTLAYKATQCYHI